MAKPLKDMGTYGGLGIELVLAIVLLGGLGHWMDIRYLGGHDWGMGTGFVLAIAVGIRNFVHAARNMQADIERAERENPAAHRWKVDESWLHPEPPEPPPKRQDPR
ncbi:MAG: AtpZ/AtpI family protein [Polyangiaceae bacterium]|jgi:F0F1-type ATP synthase assembly protein I